MGLVTFLAHQKQIEKICPEPPPKIVYSELQKHFARDEIQYYYFARSCWQWARMNKTTGFESYITGCLKQDAKDSDWTDYDFSFEHMKQIQKTIFGLNFNINNSDFFKKIIDPTKNETVINKVSRFEDEGLRDMHIVEVIEKYWNQGKSIFVIYGSTHAVIQEPVLKTLEQRESPL